MIDQTEFETYQNYVQLQNEYKTTYKQLLKQYSKCKCFACRLELILFSVELTNLNTKLSYMEEQLLPEISSVLSGMEIKHSKTNDGTTTLID